MLAIGRAEVKRIPKTHENVNVKDILYSAKCGVYVILFEVLESAVVEGTVGTEVNERSFLIGNDLVLSFV